MSEADLERRTSDVGPDRPGVRPQTQRLQIGRWPKSEFRPSTPVLLILLFSTACGYHTAGHAITLPANVHTIAIPAFVNRTQTYKIEQRLTAAVVQEMVTRTHYRILNDPSDSADATLRGTVISTSTSPLTYDSQTGRASSALVVVTVRVTLTDRQGKVLYENPSYLFRDEYQVSRELSSFFEEDSPALERLSREFARTLVSNVLEGF